MVWRKDTGIDICRIFVYIICFYAIFNGSSDRESFITFKTPEQAIHYINAPFSNDKIEDIIVGQDTCMAVFESGQDEELYAGRDMWLRKGEKGYKLISAAGVQKQFCQMIFEMKI